MPLELTNSQYDGIMNLYQEARFNADAILRENRRLAYNDIPKLKSLDKESVTFLKTHEASDIEAFLSDLSRKRRKLLAQNGYPEDFLDRKYRCTNCRDTGFIEDTGEYCHCFRELAVKQIYGEKSWLNLFKKENFDTFDLSLYESDEDKKAAIASVKVAKEFVASTL